MIDGFPDAGPSVLKAAQVPQIGLLSTFIPAVLPSSSYRLLQLEVLISPMCCKLKKTVEKTEMSYFSFPVLFPTHAFTSLFVASRGASLGLHSISLFILALALGKELQPF